MAALTTPARDVERAIDWRQVRTVLWAQWRLGVRAASQKPWMVVLTAVGWIVYAGMVLAASAGAFLFAFAMRGNATWAERMPPVFHVAFLFVLVVLSVSPALGLRGNEFLDVTKLFVYPVNHRTVFASSLLGLVASKSVLFFALPLLALTAGWSRSAADLLGGLAAVLLLVLVAVALGQTILLVFLDLFRSRRWRDVSRIVVACVVAGVYAAMRIVSWEAVRDRGLETLQTIDRWRNWAVPLPSWWAAHAVTGAGWTRWLPALALPVLLFWLVAAAARLQERAYFGEIETSRERVGASGGGIAGWIGRRLRDPLGCSLEKDLRILGRDPTVRIQLIQQFAFMVVPMVLVFAGDRSAGIGSKVEAVLVGIVYLPVLMSIGLTMNPLGTEGSGMQHALLTPARRATIVLAKLLSLTIVVGGMLALLVAASAFVLLLFVFARTPTAALGTALLTGVESLFLFAVFPAVGALVGVWFPVKAVTRAQRALKQTSGGRGGCARGLLGVAAFCVGALACAPVSLAFHHPALLGLANVDSRPFLAVTVPMAALYAALLLWAGSRLGGRALERREEEVLDVLTKPSE